MQERRYFQDDYQDSEISLVEIWLIMMKRKWIIIGTLILALLIAGLYLLSTK
ncbi:MAG: Wzz/FepE/Etk N-terminal domain-containing protein, partial [Bacteroidota bacterium]